MKYRFSGFLPGTSDLADRLRARGFDTVLITGTVTNVCCESSARDAMMSNFRTIMVSDGNAALSQAEHDASLTAFYNVFGDVMDTDMIIDALGQGCKARAAKALALCARINGAAAQLKARSSASASSIAVAPSANSTG